MIQEESQEARKNLNKVTEDCKFAKDFSHGPLRAFCPFLRQTISAPQKPFQQVWLCNSYKRPGQLQESKQYKENQVSTEILAVQTKLLIDVKLSLKRKKRGCGRDAGTILKGKKATAPWITR